MDCLFCEITAGRVACFKVWEDDSHLAFLTPFPNTPGVTVVIPRQHYPSYVFDLPTDIRDCLVAAAGRVAKKLDQLPGVGRTALVFEGFGINHIHAKLFPLHDTRMADWQPINSTNLSFTETYTGCISTHDGPRWDDARLVAMGDTIRALP